MERAIFKNHNEWDNDSLDNKEAEARACEVLSRAFIWVAEGNSLEQRGLRATVLLFCIRPDLIDGQTLESIGFTAGVTRQRVHNLAKDFRQILEVPT